MAFDSGAVSFRLFYLPQQFPENVLDMFADDAAPGLDTLREEPITGWITSRHLLDVDIKEETAYKAGFLCLALRIAERKVPTSLLQAEMKIEELAVMAAEERPFISRTEKQEIRKMVTERLLPQMPPQLKSIPFVYNPGDSMLFATALPVKQSDLFTSSVINTTGVNPLPLTPELAALERQKIDTNEWYASSFSAKVPDDVMENTPGRDFLTWLLFCAEARGGTIQVENTELAFILQGPLTFAHEGNGAHETVLRKGEPVNSAEAKTCLLAGKKLRQAKITLADGEEQFTFTFDADEFVVRTLALPKPEELLDDISMFQDRMHQLERFRDFLLGLFDEFVKERSDSKAWKDCIAEIHKWTAGRSARV